MKEGWGIIMDKRKTAEFAELKSKSMRAYWVKRKAKGGD